jgi:transposase
MERPAPIRRYVDYAAIGKESWRRATYEREPAMKNVRFVGLDVHAETIAVAVAEPDGEVRSLGVIANRIEAVKKLLKKLGEPEQLRVCYEAGPTGYVLYWQLTQLGVKCCVIAPNLVPMKATDRIKTDRRDAERLARSFRAGDLTPVWIPDAAHEALRDLVRARLVARRDQLRARNRLSRFLLRHGCRPPEKVRPWTQFYFRWLQHMHFEHAALEATLTDYLYEVEHASARIERLEQAIDAAVEHVPARLRAVIDALQALRGVAKLGAVTLAAELGTLTRFAHPRQLMGYSGAVPSEHSSGERIRRGAITKCGNAHLRRIVIEAAWAYRYRPVISRTLAPRQRNQSEAVKAIAWKAQHRLHVRYCRLVARGKSKQQAITAVGRELIGFIWAIGVETERAFSTHATTAA